MILVIVVLNAALGYVQEARAEQAVAALQRMATVTAGVLRDGWSNVPSDEVVPGDLLFLSKVIGRRRRPTDRSRLAHGRRGFAHR